MPGMASAALGGNWHTQPIGMETPFALPLQDPHHGIPEHKDFGKNYETGKETAQPVSFFGASTRPCITII